MPTFEDFDALSFDCYGTLIDWETGIAAALAPWAAAHGLAATADDLVGAFSAIETHVEQEQPTALYPEVLAATMRRIGDRLGAPVSDEEAAAFGASVGDWPAFPDSAGALARLHTRYRHVPILVVFSLRTCAPSGNACRVLDRDQAAPVGVLGRTNMPAYWCSLRPCLACCSRSSTSPASPEGPLELTRMKIAAPMSLSSMISPPYSTAFFAVA